VDVGRDTKGTKTKVHIELAEYNERDQGTIILHWTKTCVSIFEYKNVGFLGLCEQGRDDVGDATRSQHKQGRHNPRSQWPMWYVLSSFAYVSKQQI
jgi:hypothetical protein